MYGEEKYLPDARVELFKVATSVDDGAKTVRICMSSDRVDDMKSTETDLSVGESGFHRIHQPLFTVAMDEGDINIMSVFAAYVFNLEECVFVCGFQLIW